MTMRPALEAYLEAIEPEMAAVPAPRRARLDELAAFVRERRDRGDVAALTFICTHNSRRSHMAQLWAAAAAARCDLDCVRTHSGGTEATAFNPRAVAALRRAGFDIDEPAGDNPHYRVVFSPDTPALECFSKRYDHPANPRSGFAAVMTCSAADAACPVISGAALRVSIPWQDPKVADNTADETSAYDARCRQIAVEMMLLCSRV